MKKSLDDCMEAVVLRLIEIDAERGGATLATSSLKHSLAKLKSVCIDIELEHARAMRAAKAK